MKSLFLAIFFLNNSFFDLVLYITYIFPMKLMIFLVSESLICEIINILEDGNNFFVTSKMLTIDKDKLAL